MHDQYQLTTDACLLIFDPHQDLHWVERVIRKERGMVSHLLLGGDYFDAFDFQRQVPARDMAAYLRELEREWGDRITILLGNHDIPYAEAEPWSRYGDVPRFLVHRCPGWTHEKSVQVAEHLDEGFWRRCRLFQWVNGFLISHAGIAERFWPTCEDLGKALRQFDELCALEGECDFHHQIAILAAGRARGGNSPSGGLTWQDWDNEFKDELPFPQIVGHTPSPEGARRKGRSWCLDGGKTCYGILWRSGLVTIKAI